MKVKDIVADLLKLDQELEFTVNMNSGCHGYDESYNVSEVDQYEPGKDYPGAAFITIDKGCMCCGDTKTRGKFTKVPTTVNHFWFGIDAAKKVVLKDWRWYEAELKKIGKPKDYEESQTVLRYEQGKRALELAMKNLTRISPSEALNGEKATP